MVSAQNQIDRMIAFKNEIMGEVEEINKPIVKLREKL